MSQYIMGRFFLCKHGVFHKLKTIFLRKSSLFSYSNLSNICIQKVLFGDDGNGKMREVYIK
ncbi:hypothetical protein GCM10011346_24380 [Oceanobacillus neutriphilus]|uniref:Uncharacterized protein n=1 Tax=Oceanobacillus neutriphilus TaxID=531815 RepID=A0ABQ2NVK4_9BACI|nr:hypothetical protein GCM10011346_24380 [Oceanobacillus neutriphilus]